jgi:hypothetical protein
MPPRHSDTSLSTRLSLVDFGFILSAFDHKSLLCMRFAPGQRPGYLAPSCPLALRRVDALGVERFERRLFSPALVGTQRVSNSIDPKLRPFVHVRPLT